MESGAVWERMGRQPGVPYQNRVKVTKCGRCEILIWRDRAAAERMGVSFEPHVNTDCDGLCPECAGMADELMNPAMEVEVNGSGKERKRPVRATVQELEILKFEPDVEAPDSRRLTRYEVIFRLVRESPAGCWNRVLMTGEKLARNTTVTMRKEFPGLSTRVMVDPEGNGFWLYWNRAEVGNGVSDVG